MQEVKEHITTKKLIPQLRFKEFDGEWEKSTLKKEAVVNPRTKELPKKFIYIDLESVKKGMLVKEEEICLNEAPSRAQRLLDKDDILYQTVRPYQKNNLYFDRVGDYVASTGYAQIKAKGDSKYLFQFLHTTPFVNIVNRWSTGTSYPAISPSELVKIPVAFPSLPEQQKIASFLSAVDEKIQQLTKKKELLEQYKKGVMQQLFSGQLRFTDENGNEYPGWEEFKVQELINRKAIIGLLDGNHGELYPKSEEFTPEGVPYIAANSLINGLVDFNQCKRLPKERADKFKKGIAKSGDVLFAHNATVGPTAILKTDLEYAILSTTVTYYRCDTELLSNTYLLHYFNADAFVKQYTRVMSQSTRNQVPITMQKKFKVVFPCLKEQQKIATYLSSIDTKIEAVNNQITQTQTFKKGLLQQMFV